MSMMSRVNSNLTFCCVLLQHHMIQFQSEIMEVGSLQYVLSDYNYRKDSTSGNCAAQKIMIRFSRTCGIEILAIFYWKFERFFFTSSSTFLDTAYIVTATRLLTTSTKNTKNHSLNYQFVLLVLSQQCQLSPSCQWLLSVPDRRHSQQEMQCECLSDHASLGCWNLHDRWENRETLVWHEAQQCTQLLPAVQFSGITTC